MPATTYYAQVADLRASPSVPDAAPPTDDELADKLVTAEDLVDRLVGPRAIDVITGRKWDAVAGHGLTAGQRTNLTRATVIIAVALYLNPEAFNPPTAGFVRGPDFELRDIKGLSAAGQVAIKRAAELLSSARLRILTARVV